MKRFSLASVLFCSFCSSLTFSDGLTTNPQLNQLLEGVTRMGENVQQYEQDLIQKDRKLRTACWNGDRNACQELDDFLANPNLDPAGHWVEPPPGAYWPFDNQITSDPYTNQLLDQSNQAIQENRKWIEEEGIPAVRQQQEYEQTLQSYCDNGNIEACQELTGIYNRRSMQTEQLQRQWDNYYNQDWIRSFGR
jgi:hypothetical protein